jgi:hypothetical protein
MEIRKINISGTALALISLGIFIVIMLFSGLIFKPSLDNSGFSIRESELNKTVDLQLIPGDSYYYTYKVGNESANLTYAVMNGPNCTMIILVESQEAICLNKQGNDRTKMNSTFNATGMILFKPWMLALKEGWSWNITTYARIDTYEKLLESTYYSVVRIEEYKGRQVYVVRMSGEEGDFVWQWIDSEKRILVREIGPSYEVELVKGLG